MKRLRVWAKRGGLMLLLVMVPLLVVMSWKHWHFRSRQIEVEAVVPLVLDEPAILDRLQGAIQIPTISASLARLTEDSPLHQFRAYIEQSFPALHRPPFIRRSGSDFGDALIPSVLFEWPGKNPQLAAILLMSHMDVVPIESGSLSQWSHPPFSGYMDDSFVWGRGSIDCKHGVMAILEAINLLAEQGFQPERTVYVALGHDEELGGYDGNRRIAEWMEQNNRRNLHMILDEGGVIFSEFPGLDRPAALVGIAEKGYLNLRLSVDVEADLVGHSSMPPPATAINVLAAALQRVQAAPFPPRIDGGLKSTLSYLGPEMPSLVSRLAASNLWLSEPLVKSTMSAKPSGNALLRTTIAATLIEGGVKENVLPRHASATLNLRLLPGDTEKTVLARLRPIINDARVAMEVLEPSRQASGVSSTETDAFAQLHRTIREIYPDVVVAPFVLVGSTDAVHYRNLCDNIYRFIPARLSERDTQRFHGIDERISRSDFLDIVRFFQQLIRNGSAN